MAAPLTADRLLKALRDEGVRVVEVRDWRTHNRNHIGAWGPVHGVMLHHTVTTGTDGSVRLCYDGRSDLPGPLCHGVVAKDGTCYLVGNGRANHAGGGDPDVLEAVIAESYGDRPPTTHEHQGSPGAVDGNARFYGFECINMGDGDDPWPAAQQDAMVRASAALCRAHGWSAKSTIGHLEWSDWKVDPRGLSMPSLRTRVAERLAHAASWSPGTTPEPPKPPEEDDMPSPEEIARAVWGHTYEHGGVTVAASTRLGRTYAHAREARQAVAALTAQVGALSATITTLAQGGGLDAEQIQAAAEAGARAALVELGEALTNDEG